MNTDFSYRIPTDGSVISCMPPLPNGPRSVEIVNATTQTLNFEDDSGAIYPIGAGKVATVAILTSTSFRFWLAAASTGSAFAIFYRARRPTSGDFAIGGSSGATGHTRTGAQGNLWNNAATGAGGASAVYDALASVALSVFGHASAATTISLQASADGVNFYTVAQSVLAGASDFGFGLNSIGARYWQLLSSAAVTATATAQGAA